MSKTKPKTVWRISIPGWRPALLNELLGRHRMQAHRLKRRDADQLATARLVFGVPAATTKRRVKLTIYGAWRRKPDPDSPLKSTLDALVQAGLLVDDSAEWCAWETPVFERGPKRTEIELEDID